RRAPGLQEEEDDGQHEDRRLENGVVHLPDRSVDEARGIERDRVVHALRERRLQLLHAGADQVRHLERVRAGLQGGAHADGLLAVQLVRRVVVQRAELDARDVLEAQHVAGGAGAHHDLAELLRLDQATGGRHRIDDVLPGGRGLGADLAGGVLRVLRPKGGRYVGRGDAKARHLFGIDPDAHRVVARAEYGDVGDAGDPLQLVHHVDRGVVREVKRVAAVVRRDQRYDQQDVERA